MTDTAKTKKNRHIGIILRVVVAVGAICLFFVKHPFGQLCSELSRLDWWVFAAAMALYGVAQLLFVLRWRLLSSVQSVHFGYWAGLRLHFLGLFYNNLLPSSIGGDIIRAWYVTHHCDSDKREEAVLSVFVDRAVGLLGLLLMAGVFYWLVPVDVGDLAGDQVPQAQGTNGFWAENSGSIILLLAVGVILLASVGATKKGRQQFVHIVKRLWDFGLRLFFKSLRAFKLYTNNPLVLIYALGLTFMCQGMSIIGFYLCGRNLGIDVHFKYYFVVFPVSWLIGSLPLSIGGVGLMEVYIAGAFFNLMGGVKSAAAAALATCQRLVLVLGSLAGLWVHVSGGHLPDRDEILVDSETSLD
ncbi:MAG: flippase-like domain-containing protein [Anaerohalosphaera sp.]|nr:flippase-like domain-containing protein [Anaerohalosphaera sp.]